MTEIRDGSGNGDGVGPGRPPAEHRFKPGQSGNPKGRPPGVVKAARRLAGSDGRKMLRILADIANGDLTITQHALMTGMPYQASPSFKDRKECALALLERACGKVTQAHELTGKDGGPLQAVVTINGIRRKGQE